MNDHALLFDSRCSLALCLAHSAVFFAREEWLPVADARGDGKSGDGTQSQETTSEQVGAQSQGPESPITAASGNANIGGVGVSGQGGIGHQSGGVGDTDITTIESSDPAVAESAIAGEQSTAGEALEANSYVVGQAAAMSQAAMSDTESSATASIAASVDMTALNDQFGEDALQMASNAEAASTTGLEAGASESTQLADNALAAAQNETLAGVTPAQQFQAIQGEGAAGAGTIDGYSVSTIATWLTVIIGLISLAYFLKHKKLS